jgi:hypothetical protein
MSVTPRSRSPHWAGPVTSRPAVQLALAFDDRAESVSRVEKPSHKETQPSGRSKQSTRSRREPVAASPAERSLRARAAAYRLHSMYDSRDLTANARAAFSDRFTRQVDPDGVLPVPERIRRAECARKAYFAALAAKSAKARRARGGARNAR